MKATLNPPKTETKIIQVSPATVTLEVSVEFAALLLQMYGRVGGSPTDSLRGEWSDLAYEVRSLIEDVDKVKTGLPRWEGVHLKDIRGLCAE